MHLYHFHAALPGDSIFGEKSEAGSDKIGLTQQVRCVLSSPLTTNPWKVWNVDTCSTRPISWPILPVYRMLTSRTTENIVRVFFTGLSIMASELGADRTSSASLFRHLVRILTDWPRSPYRLLLLQHYAYPVVTFPSYHRISVSSFLSFSVRLPQSVVLTNSPFGSTHDVRRYLSCLASNRNVTLRQEERIPAQRLNG